MTWVLTLYRSTVGKKAVMAVTGAILVAYVIGHVSGNLLVFRGRDQINAYSAFLHSTGALLWAVRVVLLVAAALHVMAAVQLTRLKHNARTIAYAKREPQVSTIAARTIRWGGAFLFLFVVLHILHFTTGTIRPAATFSRTDVYGNVVSSFGIWWVAAFYVVAMIALGLHLYHGTWSAFRTLGLVRPTATPLKRTAVLILAIAVWFGFTIIPVAVFAGIVR
ncbi:MAG: succinate dehydrogenase cytochrome b subunit [Gemmatimonadaceae bacterium]